MEHLLPIAFIALATYAVVTILGFHRAEAEYLPMMMCSGIIALCAVQLLRQSMQPSAVRGRILDLDMRSVGIEGSKRAAIITAVLLAVYVLAIQVIGIRLAGIPFAALIPLCLMTTKSKYWVAAISVTLYYAFVVIFGDELLGIYWPRGWLM